VCLVSSFADWAGDCDFAGPVLRQYKRLWSTVVSFNSYVASRGMDPWSVLFRCAVHASLAVCIAITPSGRSCCDSGAILWSLHCDHDCDFLFIPGHSVLKSLPGACPLALGTRESERVHIKKTPRSCGQSHGEEGGRRSGKFWKILF
jgi:hypothetical protein